MARHTAAAALAAVLLAILIRLAEPIIDVWNLLVREYVHIRWNYLPMVTVCVAMALVALFALVEEREQRKPLAASRPRLLARFVAVGLLVGAGFYLLAGAVRGASLLTFHAWLGTAMAAIAVGGLVAVSIGTWLICLACVTRLPRRE